MTSCYRNIHFPWGKGGFSVVLFYAKRDAPDGRNGHWDIPMEGETESYIPIGCCLPFFACLNWLGVCEVRRLNILMK